MIRKLFVIIITVSTILLFNDCSKCYDRVEYSNSYLLVYHQSAFPIFDFLSTSNYGQNGLWFPPVDDATASSLTDVSMYVLALESIGFISSGGYHTIYHKLYDIDTFTLTCDKDLYLGASIGTIPANTDFLEKLNMTLKRDITRTCDDDPDGDPGYLYRYDGRLDVPTDASYDYTTYTFTLSHILADDSTSYRTKQLTIVP